MKLDPLSLRLFVSVVEEGTIAAAAAREYIAAVSKRLSELEDQLNTQLLTRSNKGLLKRIDEEHQILGGIPFVDPAEVGEPMNEADDNKEGAMTNPMNFEDATAVRWMRIPAATIGFSYNER